MIRVPFHPGETLRSLVVRSARRNRMPVELFAAEHGFPWPLPVRGVGKLLAFANAHHRNAGNCDDRECVRTNRPLPARDRPKQFIRQDIRVCPACLAHDLAQGGHPEEHMHERLLWSVRMYDVCPVHSVQLVTVADNDNRLWESLANGVRISPVTALPSLMEQCLHTMNYEDAQLPDLLTGMEPHAIAEACVRVGAVIAAGDVIAFDRSDAIRQRTMTDAGFTILVQGPEALARELDRIASASPAIKGKLPWPATGGLHAWLAQDRRSQAFKALRDFLGDYIVNRMPYIRPSVLGRPAIHKWHTTQTLAKAYGVSMPVMADHVARLGIAPALSIATPLWHIDDVRQLAEDLKTAIAFNDLPAQTGIPRKQAQRLVNHALLTPVAPKRDPADRLFFARRELARFEQAISANCQIMQLPPDGYARLAEVAHSERKGLLRPLLEAIDGLRPMVVVAGQEPLYLRLFVEHRKRQGKRKRRPVLTSAVLCNTEYYN